MSEIFLPIQSSFGLIGKGGIMMIPIVACSLIALTIILERLYYFRNTRENLATSFKALNRFLNDKDHEAASNFATTSPGPVSRLMKEGLDNQNLPKWKLEEKLMLTGREELKNLGKNIRALEVIATISPLMGLLGTVLGMVKAFSKVAGLKGQVDPSVLAGGIWEALLTTAAGLAVAIPAVVMLHYFDRKTENVAFQLEKCGQLMVHHFDERPEQKESNKTPLTRLVHRGHRGELA